MSAVPPNFVGPILQSHLTQRQVSAVRDSERNQRASADHQQAKAIDEKGSTVETAEDTTQVHTDAEGAGSQGRAFSSPPDQTSTDDEATRPDGEEHGRIIDFEA